MICFPRAGQAGRIGNQMWQVAGTIGIAGDRNDDFLLPENWDYRPYFSIPDWCYGPQDGLDAGDIPEHIDIRTRVYLQDYELFVRSETFVREMFKFSKTAIDVAHQTVPAELWKLERPWTSVHVRRGDNVTHPLGWHPLRSRAYYAAAIERLPKEGSVIVFTDDLLWCAANMPEWLDREVYIQSGPTRPREYADRQLYENSPPMDWIDLYLMTICDSHVIANSSYSWWGAFLSKNRHPIYPSRWFGNLLPYIDASLMFPKGWIEVDDPTQGGA